MTEPKKRTRKPYKRVAEGGSTEATPDGATPTVTRRRRRTGPGTPAWRAAGLEPHEPELDED